MLWQQYVRKWKSENFRSKIEIQRYAIDRCVEGGLIFSTVQKFMERMKVRGLEKVFRRALLIIRERFENDMLGIDATGYSTEY
ncbi:MAG: hypothetical protein ACP5H0_08010, partial [Caldisericum sp.]|uniref:hypothetical protein n=1 Tax=Caldisericum sp. TaxID=2499687 RepID=UPI003D0A3A5B